MVFVDQSAEDLAFSDRCAEVDDPPGSVVRGLLLTALMGVMLVVMRLIAVSTPRRWCSLTIRRWPRHARRMVPTNRSAKAFARGARIGVFTARAPIEVNTSERGGELRIPVADQKLDPPARPPRSICRLRACWVTQGPFGYRVTPRMCTRRVSTSITKNT